MGTLNTWQEPFLPWVESENDRRFKRYLIISVVIFMLLTAFLVFGILKAVNY